MKLAGAFLSGGHGLTEIAVWIVANGSLDPGPRLSRSR